MSLWSSDTEHTKRKLSDVFLPIALYNSRYHQVPLLLPANTVLSRSKATTSGNSRTSTV